MTETKNPSTILSSNYFEVVNEIIIKSTEVVNVAKATYDIVLKSKRNEKNTIFICFNCILIMHNFHEE